MKSNFLFLKEEWLEFYQTAITAERLVITDPRTSLIYARMALEVAVNWMYNNDHDLEKPYDTSLNSLLKVSQFDSPLLILYTNCCSKFPRYSKSDKVQMVSNLI